MTIMYFPTRIACRRARLTALRLPNAPAATDVPRPFDSINFPYYSNRILPNRGVTLPNPGWRLLTPGVQFSRYSASWRANGMGARYSQSAVTLLL